MNKIEEYIADFDPDKQAIIQALRKSVRAVTKKEVAEGIKWNALCFFKDDRAFVGIMPYKHYVSVIFDRGAELEDEPENLEGDGKLMRHIKIHSLDEVAHKNVARYIRDSYSLQEGHP